MYIGLSPAQLAGVIVLGVLGFVAVCVLFIVNGRDLVREEIGRRAYQDGLRQEEAILDRFEGPPEIVIERSSRAFAIDGELRREATEEELERFSEAAVEAHRTRLARTAAMN